MEIILTLLLLGYFAYKWLKWSFSGDSELTDFDIFVLEEERKRRQNKK